jgi:dynein heavy chain
MLRAINDVNYAKFLQHDLGLYRNITSDLFPGVELPEPDYEQLLGAMRKQCEKMNLNPTPTFDKIIQLYEMTIVRHGLMVVGDPFAGKTSCMEVL